MVSSVPLNRPPRRGHAHPISPVSYDITKEILLHVKSVTVLALCSMLSEPLGNKAGPSRSHRVRSLIGPDRRRTLACGSAYAPTTRTVRMQLETPAVPSSSVDEVQPASCCWCRCHPAGVTAETTAVDQPLLQAYRPARGRRAVRSCASVIPVSLCTGEAFRPRE